jgi:hypothetical protein
VSVKYLFPCRCGQKSVVELRQAGQSIVCRCGTTLQVPTMIELTALEVAPAESSPVPHEATWHWRQRLLLLGCVSLVAAAIAAACLYVGRPIAPSEIITPERIQQTVAQWTPRETWEAWESMRQGLDRRTDPRYEAAVLRFHAWEALTLGLALASVAMIVAGATMGKRDMETGRGGD